MDAFPAFFPLAGRTVVIAGTGDAADAKARLFEGSPAIVRRLEGEAALSADGYKGASLAFVAGDAGFCEAAARAARAAGVPVNAVDKPALSDFNTPAVIDRGSVVAAVGTGGSAPMLATLLRSDIEARVPEGAGRVAALLGGMRDEIREALPDMARRRAFLREALAGPAAQAALAGDMDAAYAALREALTARATGTGRVRFVRGSEPIDLLTLRAARALAEADVLAFDEGVSPQVIELARRDARRLAADEASPNALAALASEGLQVVRVTAGPSPPGELDALKAAGAEIDVIPVAAS